LIYLLPLGIGCQSLTRAAIERSQTRFLSQFSLQTTIENVSGAAGLDCARFGAGGGIGATSGSIGTSRVSNSQYSSAAREMEESQPFQERSYMESLKSEIERQIQSTGAEIKAGTLNDNGFQIEYAEVRRQGTVKASGQRQGRFCIVTSKIEEKNGKEKELC
jgi:hypothetical protein